MREYAKTSETVIMEIAGFFYDDDHYAVIYGDPSNLLDASRFASMAEQHVLRLGI